MDTVSRNALVERLKGFNHLVEIGIGQRTDVAAELTAYSHVTAIDIIERSVPSGVQFIQDDVTSPQASIYCECDALYALNLPPELHHPVYDIAVKHNISFVFTTLGTEFPEIPTQTETLPRETIFWAQLPNQSPFNQ